MSASKKAPVFKGWVTLGPRWKVRAGDRFTYHPQEALTDPEGMCTVFESNHGHTRIGCTVQSSRARKLKYEGKPGLTVWVFRRIQPKGSK